MGGTLVSGLVMLRPRALPAAHYWVLRHLADGRRPQPIWRLAQGWATNYPLMVASINDRKQISSAGMGPSPVQSAFP